MLLSLGVGEDSWESPDCKKIQPVHPKRNQSWQSIGSTDTEAETPILWPPDAKSWLTGKDPDAGKDWRQEEKGMREDEMVGWHHWLNGHKFEQAPVLVMELQRVRHDWVTKLNWTELIIDTNKAHIFNNESGCVKKRVGLRWEYKWREFGTSLVVQWLKLQASNARGMGSVPYGRTRIPHTKCHGQEKKKKRKKERNGTDLSPSSWVHRP